MEEYFRDKVKKVSLDEYVFQPVISFYSDPSISVHTELNVSYQLNVTSLPRYRPMEARFDPLSATFKVMSTLESFNLVAEGLDINITKINGMTFKRVVMTENCTTGKRKEIYLHLIYW